MNNLSLMCQNQLTKVLNGTYYDTIVLTQVENM
jgi:hypothetical protein